MAYPTASGIRFNDCMFSEPAPLNSSGLPGCAGLFVILAEDGSWAPKPFQPVYFGEFGNNAPGAALLQEATRSLKLARGKVLYLSVLALPFSTTAQRWALCAELIRAYNPSYQTHDAMNRPTELVHRLDELEKKHHEQTAQLMWLRATAEQMLGALPERRRIGFLPESLPAAL